MGARPRAFRDETLAQRRVAGLWREFQEVNLPWSQGVVRVFGCHGSRIGTFRIRIGRRLCRTVVDLKAGLTTASLQVTTHLGLKWTVGS